MLTNSLGQQKRELLKRLATERVLALESAENARLSVAAGVASVRGSGRFVRHIGLVAAGLVAAGACVFAVKGRSTRSKVLAPSSKSGIFRALLLQGATIVLFPCLRELLANRLAASARTAHASARPHPAIDFSRYNPANLFFRWLGLDK